MALKLPLAPASPPFSYLTHEGSAPHLSEPLLARASTWEEVTRAVALLQ